jgi:CheY-like chemotaxis protein
MSNVLIVDDNPNVLSTVKIMLESLGHSVIEAKNGERALASALIDKNKIDVIVTDLYMPEMDGIEFLEALKEEITGIPVIGISGGGNNLKRKNSNFLFKNSGLTNATLDKPFTIEELKKTVEEVTGEASDEL